MSGKIMGAIWDLELTQNKQLVLLAMADHADHTGNNVYPSIGLIAWKTGYSQRQVQRIIRELKTDQLLIPVKQATPRSPTVYFINVKAGKQKPEYQEGRHSRVTPEPAVPKDEGRHPDVTPEVTQLCHPRGDTQMSPDPSLEPSVEPSIFAAAAHATPAPASENPQTVNPEMKRESVEPDTPIVKEALQSPNPPAAPPLPAEDITTRNILTPPDGFTVAYSNTAGQHVAHLFAAPTKHPKKCLKCHADLGTWSQQPNGHAYTPCCDWHAVDPSWTPEVKDALAKLCKKDWAIPAHKKAMGGCLNSISQREPVTIEKLRRFYTNWYKCIYKGIQGNAPEPYEVTNKWVELTESDDCKEKPPNGNKRYQPDDYWTDPALLNLPFDDSPIVPTPGAWKGRPRS